MPTLTWIGKDKVVNHHHDVPYSVFEKVETFTAPEGTPENSTNNRIIHGDNLAVLKSLLPEFEGRVNCIYIDPPYNTGNEGWVYNDNVNDPRIKKWLGDTVGKDGEDLTRHDKWLCMMYPRLKLLKKMLHKNNGTIWISIGDDEIHNLRQILDEVFGSTNFVACNVWQKRYSRENRGAIGDAHEYIIVYAMNPEFFKQSRNKIALDEKQAKIYKNPDNKNETDPSKRWRGLPMTAQGYRPNQMYKITSPNGSEHFPPEGRCWSMIESEYFKFERAGRIYWGKDGNAQPSVIRYLSEVEGLVPWTWWPHEDGGHTDEAKKEMQTYFSTQTAFDTPKPTRLIERILQIATQKDSIILDSFAGSGTTAHATLKLNAQDGGNRQIILCEMMDYADTITAERVRRVMTGYGEGNKKVEGLGGAFEYYQLGEPLFHGEYLNESVGIIKIRQYVAHSENIPLDQRVEDNPVSPSLLGINPDTVWIFHYERDSETILDAAFLGTLKYRANGYAVPAHSIIYADRCVLTIEQLDRFGIRFKKIPRDITRL